MNIVNNFPTIQKAFEQFMANHCPTIPLNSEQGKGVRKVFFMGAVFIFQMHQSIGMELKTDGERKNKLVEYFNELKQFYLEDMTLKDKKPQN